MPDQKENSDQNETSDQSSQQDTTEKTEEKPRLTPLQRIKAGQASAQQNLKAARRGGESASGEAGASGAMNPSDHAQRPMHSNKMGDS